MFVRDKGSMAIVDLLIHSPLSRACFKKKLSLHILAEKFLKNFFRISPKKISFHFSKNSDDLFFFFSFFSHRLFSDFSREISLPSHYHPHPYTHRHTLFSFSTPYFLLSFPVNPTHAVH